MVVVAWADTLDELVEVGATIVLDQQKEAMFVASKNRVAVSMALQAAGGTVVYLDECEFLVEFVAGL